MNTAKLKSVFDLACKVSSSEFDKNNVVDVDTDQLEKSRELCIIDYVNSLEPIAYNHHFIDDTDGDKEEVLSHKSNIPAILGLNYTNLSTPLFDLSDIRSE